MFLCVCFVCFLNSAEKGGGDNNGDHVAGSGGGAVDHTCLAVVTHSTAGERGRWRKMEEKEGWESWPRASRWSKHWLTPCASPLTARLCKQRGSWLCKKKNKERKKEKKPSLPHWLQLIPASFLMPWVDVTVGREQLPLSSHIFIYLLFIFSFFFFVMASLQVLTSLGLKKKKKPRPLLLSLPKLSA